MIKPRTQQFLACSLLALPLVALVVFSSGCGGGSRGVAQNESESTTLEEEVNYLNQAMAYVTSLERFDLASYHERVSGNLNDWLSSIEAPSDWEPDPLVQTLPEEFLQSDDLKRLSSFQLLPDDVHYLQEVSWAASVSEWVVAQDRFVEFRYLFGKLLSGLDDATKQSLSGSQQQLTDVLKLAHPNLSHDEAVEMTQALLLFDWTVRNVQLAESLEPTAEVIAATSLILDSSLSLPQRGVPGPGYTQYVEQTLRYGRGDALQRARVFIALARQLELDAFVLAVEDPSDKSLEPWLVAVEIGGQAYLFDTRLGLPIVGFDSNKVVSLSELLASPQMLRTFDLTAQESTADDTRYPMERLQLGNLIALIDAAPESLSLRMETIESSLTGESRLRLSFQPSLQAKRIEGLDGIKRVQLWELPIETLQFRNIFERRVSENYEPVMRTYFQKEGFYDHYLPLQTARHRQLLGLIEKDGEDESAGAKQLLFDERKSDEEINELDTNRAYQFELGIDRMGTLSVDQKNMMIGVYKDMLKMVRAQATYWLGLCHMETQNPSNAANWLTRVENEDQRKLWAGGMTYNLGRCYESMLDYKRAIEWYRKDTSAQRNGNLLRARWLQALLDESPSLKKAPATSNQLPTVGR